MLGVGPAPNYGTERIHRDGQNRTNFGKPAVSVVGPRLRHITEQNESTGLVDLRTRFFTEQTQFPWLADGAEYRIERISAQPAFPWVRLARDARTFCYQDGMGGLGKPGEFRSHLILRYIECEVFGDW